jgi:hypothetical protein
MATAEHLSAGLSAGAGEERRCLAHVVSLVYCAVGVVGVVRIFGVSGFNNMIRCTHVCLPAFAAVSLGGVAFCRFLNQLVGLTPKFSTGAS